MTRSAFKGPFGAPRPATEQQKDLFTKRFRNVRAPQPSELQLQISLVAQCRWRLRDDVLMFHVPNGEHRDKRVAAKLKAMGVLPGVSDLVFVWKDDRRARILFFELKAAQRGKLSADQLTFANRATAAGCQFAMASDIDTALDILRGLNLFKPGRER